MSLFDAYVFADWSAASCIQPKKPTADAVWTSEYVPRDNYRKENYHRLRKDAITHITNLLIEHVREKRRVLVGFDFPYGYPSGFAQALGFNPGAGAWWKVWAELADRIKDLADNKNNRFKVAETLNTIAGNSRAGPFWGCPVRYKADNLNRCSPDFPFRAANGTTLQRLRLVETRLPGTKEVWGLYGPGRAGSQALVGIPYLYGLRLHPKLMRFSLVWPFETLFTPIPSKINTPFILHAEIWPGVIKKRVQALMGKNPGIIRDEAQVRAMCTWTAEMDQQNLLGNFLAQPVGLNPNEIQFCLQEEGWILGAK